MRMTSPMLTLAAFALLACAVSACGITPGAPATIASAGATVNTIIAKADTKVVAVCAKAAIVEPLLLPISDALATAVDPSTGALIVTAIDDAGKAACNAANAAYQGYQVQAPLATVASVSTTTPPPATP